MSASANRRGVRYLLVALSVPLAIATSEAQSSMPARSLPDIAGLRPGMTVQEAYKLLNVYNPHATIKVGQVQVREMSNKPVPVTLLFQSSASPGMVAGEIIQLELTLPPEKAVVWAILRRVVFEAGKGRNRTSLLAELRQKYGQEGDGMTLPIVNIYWVFDEGGRRAETGGP